MKHNYPVKLFLITFSLVSVILSTQGCGRKKITQNENSSHDTVNIFVSIAPQKYFARKIAGEAANISIMVSPGHSPATYEPLPAQMMKLQKTDIYFRIGVPFENAWIHKIEKSNPNLKIVDTRKNISLRKTDSFYELFNDSDSLKQKKSSDNKNNNDPHIWLSPSLAIIQAENMKQALIEAAPDKKEIFEKNYSNFAREMNSLSETIHQSFKGMENKKLMVFHPAWGYFADEFGLKQIPIEVQGKEPSQKEIISITRFAKKSGIRFIFVQSQFSTAAAENIAQSINGKVIRLNPLSENYYDNILNIAETIKKHLDQEP